MRLLALDRHDRFYRELRRRKVMRVAAAAGRVAALGGLDALVAVTSAHAGLIEEGPMDAATLDRWRRFVAGSDLPAPRGKPPVAA